MPYPAGPGCAEIQTQGEPGWTAKSKARLGPRSGVRLLALFLLFSWASISPHWPLGVPRLYCPGRLCQSCAS